MRNPEGFEDDVPSGTEFETPSGFERKSVAWPPGDCLNSLAKY